MGPESTNGYRLFLLSFLSIALTSCGGHGGGGGGAPAATPKFAYVANQFSNNVSAFTINASTGALTPVAGSPFVAGTHPVSVTVDPSGKFAYVANFSSNNVSAFMIDAASGALTAVAGSPFAAGTASV